MDLEEAEDWCFVCKDGGKLRVCDYKGCNKVYHAKCVSAKTKTNTFLAKRKLWFCDHHSCSACCSKAEKINFSCLMCTYSVCNTCRENRKILEFVLVRGEEKSGLCEDCYELVGLAEKNAECDRDGENIDFEDVKTFETRFKECWEILKEKKGLYFNDGEIREVIEDDEEDGVTFKELLLRKKAENVVGPSTEESRIEENDDDEPVKNHWLSKQNKRKVVILDWEKFSSSDEKENNVENVPDEESRLTKKPKFAIPNHVTPSVSGEKETHVESSLRDVDDADEEEDFLPRNISEPKKPLLVIPSCVRPPVPAVSNEKKKIGMYPDPARNPISRCFASVVSSNIKQVYLRRSLVVSLITNHPDCFGTKLIGSFIRIEKHSNDYIKGKSTHQLTQVKGMIRKKNGDILLHILTRDVPISALSDCDFSEQECRELKERVENFEVRRPTVAEIEYKAKELRGDILKDWTEREAVRLRELFGLDKNDEHGWTSADSLCKYEKLSELTEMLKKITEEKRLVQMEPQIVVE